MVGKVLRMTWECKLSRLHGKFMNRSRYNRIDVVCLYIFECFIKCQ